MPEYNLVFPMTKFNHQYPLWMIAAEGIVVLQNFEVHAQSYSPRKFRLFSDASAEFSFEPISIELEFIEQLHNYVPHYLGYSLDLQKTKCCLVAIDDCVGSDKLPAGFELCITDLGSRGENHPIIPVPIFLPDRKSSRNLFI